MKVYFSQEMSANTDSYSPSAGKPALAVQSWQNRGFVIELIEPAPATLAQLYRAHDQAHVDGVLDCTKNNGFGNKSKPVADSLLYTNGAMIAAVGEAVRSNLNTCAPVSGFHHAGWSFASGYCTFNGLMVAALDLLESVESSRVGILDLDQHYGNGTDDILNNIAEPERIVHYTAGKKHHVAEKFLDALPELIVRLYAECDVLIYQAGADPHIDDPLGGWMTTDQLYQRDVIVFETARQLSLPVAWNLAGGYQRNKSGSISPVLRIHDNTMMACLEAMNK